VNALRGGGKKLHTLIIDENFYMCDEAYRVLFPLLANGAAFIMASSQAQRQTRAYLLREAKCDRGLFCRFSDD